MAKVVLKADEGLMMMQELDDRLKEQIDKLEHIRLAAVELKDNLSAGDGDLSQLLSDHVEWLSHLSERVESLHMNTSVFVQSDVDQINLWPAYNLCFAEMNPKPRAWSGRQASKHSDRRGHALLADDAQSEICCSPRRTRRNSDAASEMSCNW